VLDRIIVPFVNDLALIIIPTDNLSNSKRNMNPMLDQPFIRRNPHALIEDYPRMHAKQHAGVSH